MIYLISEVNKRSNGSDARGLLTNVPHCSRNYSTFQKFCTGLSQSQFVHYF